MEVVVYGAEKAPPGFRVVMAEELEVAYFSEEEWRDFLRWYAGVHNL